MGVAKKGPIIYATDHLLLEYTDGSMCESDGLKTTYTTIIHLVCDKRALVRSTPTTSSHPAP